MSPDCASVSVIVPTYQRAAALERTLSALRGLDYPTEALEIVVVDDGSTDSTREVVERFPGVRYLWQANRGVASARNRGAKVATGEILMFLDDDIVIAPDNLHRHLGARAAHGECIVAGHADFDPDLRAMLARSPFGRFRLWTEEVAQNDLARRRETSSDTWPRTAPTPNLTISRKLFSKLGGFDERFPVGAEDQDLCWRALAAGHEVVYDLNIRTIHNDQHRDLLALCRREERGAIGIVCLTRKHADFPRPRTLALNGPLRRTDKPRVVIRKLTRSILITPPALWVAHRLVSAMERLRPDGGWPLEFLYRALTGLYVFRGVRRGFRVTAREPWRLAHYAPRPRHRSIPPA